MRLALWRSDAAFEYGVFAGYMKRFTNFTSGRSCPEQQALAGARLSGNSAARSKLLQEVSRRNKVAR
jgi:hypothetical protein